MKAGSLLVKGGRIIDPCHCVDMVGDLLLLDGKVCWMRQSIPSDFGRADITVHAEGKVVCPGFVDLHVHLREPGFEEKETVATGTLAAARRRGAWFGYFQ